MAEAAAESEPAAGRWRRGLRDLHPAYFAMVMATGIVSLAAHMLGMARVAWMLLALNLLFFVVLSLATVARLIFHFRRMVDDLCDHRRGVGFFTTVAGVCVLGSQLLIVARRPHLAVGLWLAGLVLWALITYAVFTAITVSRNKPTLDKGIHGGWLVAVVATQAVSLLGGQLLDYFPETQELVLFTTLVLWLGGGMLYVWIIALIFYRYAFFELDPSDLAPPYWINMGAMAISTLAGTVLIGNATRALYLLSLVPFLTGFTLFFWATATWWIPMLVILGIWRHGVRRFPLRYDPLYWGGVFPLGMYTVCTYRLAQAIDLPLLFAIPKVFVFVALAAWALTFFGLLQSLLRPSPA